MDDPFVDGWNTEAFSQSATKQLKELGELITAGEPIEAAALAFLLTNDVTCGLLIPQNRKIVFADGALKVERNVGDVHRNDHQSADDFRGVQSVVAQLESLAAQLRNMQHRRADFKLFHIRDHGGTVVTTQHLALVGQTQTGWLEQHATWIIRWTVDAADVKPKINSIEVEAFEQVSCNSGQSSLFSDCTQSAMVSNPVYESQFLRGLNHWLGRIQDSRTGHLYGATGIAVGDVNGDRLDDLYVCQEGGLPNRLFVQNSDGTVRDVSAQSGTDWLFSSRSALFVDLDNDGNQDLVVAIRGHLLLAAGDGQGRFDLREVLPAADDSMSLSAADYDQDGDLDLYLCVYSVVTTTEQVGPDTILVGSSDVVYVDSNAGEANSLFRNEITSSENWRFADVTAQVGLDVNNGRYSFAAAWEDFDNDGDMDLYVANDVGRNNLFRNDEGLFEDVASGANVEDAGQSMGVTWGDYDRDGWPDLYVSNMYSAAGNRVMHQRQFKPGIPQDLKDKYLHLARGNTLLRNECDSGDPHFRDVSLPAGVTMGRWAWSSNFVDLNNDGWEDLVVTNGYVTTDDTGDL